MKKLLPILFLAISSISFAQDLINIKVQDAETKLAIANARVILDDQVYYSNEDGNLLLSQNAENFEVSLSGYETLKVASFQSTISLKPYYKDIDEIKIINVDVKKILKEVLKSYDKIYYSKPAIYDITYSQRSFENNTMKQLMVADGKFWLKDGTYNYKDSFKNRFDEFVQLQIDDLRYLKNEPNDFSFKLSKKGNEFINKHDYTGNLFFGYQIQRLMGWFNLKNAASYGRLIFENTEIQEIFYKIKTESNLIYSGKFTFNKKDKAIIHFELDFEQSRYKPYELVDDNGAKIKYQLGNGSFSYDFYKSGEKYVPSKVSIYGSGFKYITDTNTFEYRSGRDIIFKNHNESTKNPNLNPVKINEPFWKNLPITEDKGQTNLTKEEQDFINEKFEED